MYNWSDAMRSPAPMVSALPVRAVPLARATRAADAPLALSSAVPVSLFIFLSLKISDRQVAYKMDRTAIMPLLPRPPGPRQPPARLRRLAQRRRIHSCADMVSSLIASV